MICLLCCESNADFIALSSEQSRNTMIPSILLKYFRFMFENEPHTGEICQKCWLKVEAFHQFYLKIEEIQSTTIKNSIYVESFECDLKVDDDSNGDFKDFDLSQETEFSTATSWPEIVGESSDSSRTNAENAQNDTKDSILTSNNDTVATGEAQRTLEPNKEKYYTKVKCNPNKFLYVCDLCNESFTRTVSLKNHLKSRHSLNFQCKFCDKFLLNSKTLKTHIINCHELPKDRKPAVKRRTPTKLTSHKFKSIKCSICLEYFLTEAQLTKHQKLTHFALPFKCTHTQCKESFETLELLEEHRKSAHMKVQCPHCPKKVLEHLLDLHIQRAHNKTFQTVCEQCGKIFPDNFARKYHINMDHGNPDRVQCDLCKGFFKNKYNLQKHIKVVHLEGPQQCSECGKITPNSKALQAHMLIHKQPNKECLVCGRRFKHSSKLREHSYIHSGKTDAYSCNFCGKTFRFGSSWSAHRMKAHPEEMAAVKQRLGKLKDIASQKMYDNGLR